MRSISGRFLRFARTHGTAILVLASVMWIAVSLFLAVAHGAHRRATFNGAGAACSHEPCRVQAPLAGNP